MQNKNTDFSDFNNSDLDVSGREKLPCCVICLERKDEPMISFLIGKLGYCKRCLTDMATGKIDRARFWRSDISIEQAIEILNNYNRNGDEKNNA
jgi:hypothetical protein